MGTPAFANPLAGAASFLYQGRALLVATIPPAIPSQLQALRNAYDYTDDLELTRIGRSTHAISN